MRSHIQELSASVQSKLRSGIALTSVAQCIEELVLNAIDSGGTNIAVRVDLDIFRLQVVDNGEGISEDNIKLIGSRYATNKCHSLEDLKCNLTKYGFRGEALASIIHMSGIVDIVSHHKDSLHTLSKLFTYGKEKSVTYCHTNRPTCGTTITIQDFMYNMPVRKKILKEALDIEKIKCRMERIVLVLPHVAISLRNDKTNQMVLEVKKCCSILTRFSSMFGSEHGSSLAEINHSKGQFKVSGFISTQAHLTKALQFIYINGRSVLQTKIHSFMNDLLSRSSIIRGKVMPSFTLTGPEKMPSSPPKGLRLYGAFILNVICSRTDYDICLEPKKTLVEFSDWQNFLICLEELVLKFIEEEGLTISLDERFRKSEKQMCDDFELPVPHSSQARLKVFSNPKYEKSNGILENNINKDIAINDIKSVIHGRPAQRTMQRPSKKDLSQNYGCRKKDINDLQTAGLSSQLLVPNFISSSSTKYYLSELENSSNNYLEQRESNFSLKPDRNSKLSSLQELKLVHEITTKALDITACNTPVNPNIPSASLSSSISPSDAEDNNEGKININKIGKSPEPQTHVHNQKIQSLNPNLTKMDEKIKKVISKSLYSFKFHKSDEKCENTVTNKTDFQDLNTVLCNEMNSDQKFNDESFHFRPVSSTLLGTTFPLNPTLTNCDSGELQNSVTTKTYLKKDLQGTKVARNINKRHPLVNFEGLQMNVSSEITHCNSKNHVPIECKKFPSQTQINANFSKAGIIDQLDHHADSTFISSKLVSCFDTEMSSSVAYKNISYDEEIVHIECESDKKNLVQTEHTEDLNQKHMRKEWKDRSCSSLEALRKMNSIKNTLSKESEIYLSNTDKNSKLSSLQELKLVHEMSTKVLDSALCKTPFNPVVPSISPRSTSSDEVDVETNGVKPLQNRQSKPLKHSLNIHHKQPNQALGHILGKKYKETVKRKNILKSLQSFKFHKTNKELEKRDLNKCESINEDVSLSSDVNRDHRCDRQEDSFHIDPISSNKKEISLSTKRLMDMDSSNIEKHFLQDTNIEVIQNALIPPSDLQSEMIPLKSTSKDPKTLCNFLNCMEGQKCLDSKSVEDQKCINSECMTGQKFINSEGNIQLNKSIESVNEDSKKVNESYISPTLNTSLPLQDQDNGTNRNASKVVTLQKSSNILKFKQGQLCPALSFSMCENTKENFIQKKSPSNDETGTISTSSNHFHSVKVQPNYSLNAIKENIVSLNEGTDIFPSPLDITSDQIVIREHQQSKDTGNLFFYEKSSTSDIYISTEVCSNEYLKTSLSTYVIHPEAVEMTKLNSPSVVIQPNCSLNNTIKENIVIKESQESKDPGNLCFHKNSSDTCISNEVCSNEFLKTAVSTSIHHAEGVGIAKLNSSSVVEKAPVSSQLNTEDFSKVTFQNGRSSTNITDSFFSLSERAKDHNTIKNEGLPGQSNINIENESLQSSWKSVSIANGKKIYINLRTGNTSFVPPLQDLTPMWESSQSMGEIPLQIPITDNHSKVTDHFTLSHGFKRFLPTKQKLLVSKISSCKKESSDHIDPINNLDDNNSASLDSRVTDQIKTKLSESTILPDVKIANNQQCISDVMVEDRQHKSEEEQSGILRLNASVEAFLKENGLIDLELVKNNDNLQNDDKGETMNAPTIHLLSQAKHSFEMDAEILCSGTEDTIHAPKIRSYNIVHPYKFTSDMLKKSQVIGQVDKKFIVLTVPYHSSSPDLIILVDQHAADERVQLEKLLRQSFELKQDEDGIYQKVLKKASVEPPIEISFTNERIQLMKHFRKAFGQLGLECTLVNETTALFHRLPNCLVPKDSTEKYTRRCQTARFIVEATVIEICENIRAYGGTVLSGSINPDDVNATLSPTLPKPLAYVMNTIACRSAIKFGESLSAVQCQILIASLAQCQLPFQCAHGRPSLVPIVDLKCLKANTKDIVFKPNIKRMFAHLNNSPPICENTETADI